MNKMVTPEENLGAKKSLVEAERIKEKYQLSAYME
jgi:hypothetical protein